MIPTHVRLAPLIASVLVVPWFWAAGAAGVEDPKVGLSAEEILKTTLRAYSGCRTYRDEGRVINQFFGPDGKAEKPEPEDRFTTTFVRPDRFRFDYRHNGAGAAKRSVVWTIDRGARSWWDLDGRVERPESLDFALGSRAGVTWGASSEIPTLLLATYQDAKSGRVAPFSQLKDLKRLDDSKIDGVDCHQIEGRLVAFNFRTGQPFDTVYTYGIEKATSLIRLVRSETVAEKVRSVTSISYKPQFDGLVDDKSLTFDPATDAKSVDSPSKPPK